jgi:hypothetical protein
MEVPAVFGKLNFKQQPDVFVLDAPASFLPVMNEIAELVGVHTRLGRVRNVVFALQFATQLKQVEAFAERVAKVAVADATIWVAYPKQSSKRYKCEFNRDTGWAQFGELGFEPVRQVAIDEDWSALRFRRAEHIPKMIRSFATSDAGKKKVQGKPHRFGKETEGPWLFFAPYIMLEP